MSGKSYNGDLLEDHHNVARYCGERVISEIDDLAKSAVFKVRDDEDHLSVPYVVFPNIKIHYAKADTR